MKTRKNILRPIRKLVRSHCASFSAESNGSCNVCHYGPDDQPRCSFFREDGQYPEYLKKGLVRCRYFEQHVLPIDPAVELAYWGRHPEGEQGQMVRECCRCGTSFTKRSNRQQYCDQCQVIVSRERARDRQRKKYWENKTQNLTV